MTILTSHPRFVKDVQKLRSWLGVPVDGFRDEESAGEWYEGLFQDGERFKEFRTMLTKVLSEFRLASNFLSAVEMYLVYNKILAPDSVYISMDFNKDLEQKELKVQIFGETREEDWRRIWHTVRKLQKYLPGYNPGRFRGKTNLLAEKLAYEMAVSEKDYGKITEALHNAGFGTHGDIEKLISNFRTRLKKFNS